MAERSSLLQGTVRIDAVMYCLCCYANDTYLSKEGGFCFSSRWEGWRVRTETNHVHDIVCMVSEL